MNCVKIQIFILYLIFNFYYLYKYSFKKHCNADNLMLKALVRIIMEESPNFLNKEVQTLYKQDIIKYLE